MGWDEYLLEVCVDCILILRTVNAEIRKDRKDGDADD